MARRDPMAKPRGQTAPWWQGLQLRRWLRRLVLAGVLLMLLGMIASAVGWAMRPDTLPIRSVQIQGEFHHLDRRELEAALGPHVRGGFFSVDIGAMERAASKLPWVYEVTVRRLWPDTLQVQVTEQIAVARWGDSQLVNRYGDVFSPTADSRPAGLPSLTGGEGRQRSLMRRYLAVQARLADVGLEVSGMREDARQAWTIELANGGEVLMGRGVGESHLERLLRIYPRIAAQRDAPIERMDLRYTNGIAVAWGETAPVGQ